MDDLLCQVCGSRNCPPLIARDHWCYHRCEDCRLVFLSPMLDDQALAELYDNPKNSHTRPSPRKKFSKLPRARGRIRHLAKAMPSGPKDRLFLDIGCSWGSMTQAALQAGFTPWGIDLDNDAVAHAEEYYPGPTYRVAGLTAFADEFKAQFLQPFDAVYCSEVLEHVPDANAFIASIASVMAQGGVLYLTTPDIGHWRRPKNLTAWDVFTPPHHCLFFSEFNLRTLLKRYGLEIYHRQWAFKPGLKVLARKVGGVSEGPA